MWKKYEIRCHEVAIYEVVADSKEEAVEEFNMGEGDFIGYDDGNERVVKVRELDEAPYSR